MSQAPDTDQHRGVPPLLVEDLVAGYGDKIIVEGVSFRVDRGQTVALVGQSGCGKSTILKCLVGLLEPKSGRILVFGQDLWAAGPDERQSLLKRLGLVFQQGALLGSLTVAENLSLALELHSDLPSDVIETMVRARLAQVGLADAAHLLPAELSGGMRKRISVARAMMMDPEVLLCDEPTSGLDPVVAAGVDELLADLSRQYGTSMLVVSHDLASVRLIASHVLVMQSGRIVARGTFEELAGSGDEQVRDFFARQPERRSSTAATLAHRLGIGVEC